MSDQSQREGGTGRPGGSWLPEWAEAGLEVLGGILGVTLLTGVVVA